MTRHTANSIFLTVLVATTNVTAYAADVTLDGTVVPRATTTMSIPVDVTEYRELGTCPHLLPGCPKPSVCVTASGAIASLDAQFAGAVAARFTVGVEDGRSFSNCVPISLNSDGTGGKRRYVYCLRCEAVSAP